MGGRISAAVVLMLVAGAQAQNSVTLFSQNLCAVTGSTVKIFCKYTTTDSSITERQWYLVQRSEVEHKDLRTDPQYSGRVSVSTFWNDCTLTMRNVRGSDSGVYTFRFRKLRDEWISASSGVTLTITDLQVKVDPETVGQREVKLTCSTICSITQTQLYNWYRNGHKLNTYGASIVLYTSVHNEGNYSCSVSVRSHRSPAVCVLGKECWGVTYTPERVCALKGSSVDLSCSYKYPVGHTVTKSFWFIKEQQAGVEPVDVREEEENQGRVQYRQSSQNDCSMTITHLRESDAHIYRFRFHNDRPGGEYIGEPGVSLSVTDLKVTVSDRHGLKHMICTSTCTPSYNPTYIWFRNEQRVSHCTSVACSVSAVSGAVSYRCAAEGHENLISPPVYPPRNTRAVVVPSGERVEGDSVTLTCSSDANPPVHTYSWFKQRAAADTLLGTGQNYSITNISSQHSGLYYCTTHNQLGQHNSTTALLGYPPRVPSITDHVSGDSVTLLCYTDSNPISNYTWYKNTGSEVMLFGNGPNLTLAIESSGRFYCVVQNQFGSSNSTIHKWSFASGNTAWTYTASGVFVGLFLTLTAVCLWMRRRAAAVNNRSEESSAEHDSTPVYGNVSALDMTSDPTQDGVHYSSVHFSRSHTQEVLYSTVQLPNALKSLNQEDEVEYATVNFTKTKVSAW